MVHFIGFRNDCYWNAVKIFGLPDIIHRYLDNRAVAEIAPGDIVVFADAPPATPSPYSFDDSQHF